MEIVSLKYRRGLHPQACYGPTDTHQNDRVDEVAMIAGERFVFSLSCAVRLNYIALAKVNASDPQT